MTQAFARSPVYLRTLAALRLIGVVMVASLLLAGPATATTGRDGGAAAADAGIDVPDRTTATGAAGKAEGKAEGEVEGKAEGKAEGKPAGEASDQTDGESAAEAPATPPAAVVNGPKLLHVVPPRDSARSLGDVVTYRALIGWPEGWEIDRDGIPAPATDNASIELHGYSVSPAPDQCGECRWIDLRWQVFKAVRMTEDLPLPTQTVRMRRGNEIVTIELPPTPLSVSPLVPWDRRKGWAESQRPGWGPFWLDATRPWQQAGVAALIALLGLLGWGWASGRWFVARGTRPFATAWRAVRARRGSATEQADADDLRHWHRAFDATAGETIVPGRLDAFFAARPQYAPLAPEIREVFEASQRVFFTDTAPDAARLPRETLVNLLRRLADVEFRPLGSANARTDHAAV